MGNPRMHISPLAGPSQTADASRTLIAESRGINRHLGQFSPSIMLADDNRLLYGLTAIEDAPLPHDIPKLSPRSSIFDGQAVGRAVSGVELAHLKLKPFEGGEHANNTESGDRIELQAMHLGPIAIHGFSVTPNNSRCTAYEVSAGTITAQDWGVTSDRMTVDVAAATLMRTGLDADHVVYLEIPVVYGLGLPRDEMIPDQFGQITFPVGAGVPRIGIGIGSPDSFAYLPREVVNLGYPSAGLIYVMLAVVNGGSIFQPDSIGDCFFSLHTHSVPYR